MVNSIEISSDNHFLDNLGNHNFISVCVVKEHWDAYSQQSGWDRALVSHLDLSGELRIHGAVIRGQQLKDLARDLHRYQCRVNRDGFSFYSDTAGKSRRLNEMFPWYKYGVTPRFGTVWNRLELSNDKKVIVDLEQAAAASKAEVEAVKKREAELRREIQKKVEELSREVQDKDKALKGKEAELSKKDKTIQALKNALAALSTD